MGKDKRKEFVKFDKEYNAKSQAKTKCTCGRKVIMLPNVDHQICSWCGRKVKNESISRFRYMLSKEINKNENN